jgi:hypothetical protein
MIIRLEYVMLQNINTVVNVYKNKYRPAVVTITSSWCYRHYNIIALGVGAIQIIAVDELIYFVKR